MAVKVCVVLSPAAGPAAFPRIAHPGAREDIVHIAVQRHVSGEDLAALGECLEEMAEHPVIRFQSEAVPLHGGTLCLLGDSVDARFEGHRLVPHAAPLNLDAMLTSLASLGDKAAAAVLPGRELPGVGVAGLSALQTAGAQVYAALEDGDAEGWTAQLESAGIRFTRLPLASLFEPSSLHRTDTAITRRLLIADDDATTRKMFGELCRLSGYACDFAADGLDVLNLLRKEKFDGLILDINMPEMDGIEALERLKSERPGLPVLVITGETDPGILDRAKRLGAVGVLPKSFTAEQFQRALAVFAAPRAA